MPESPKGGAHDLKVGALWLWSFAACVDSLRPCLDVLPWFLSRSDCSIMLPGSRVGPQHVDTSAEVARL